MFHGGLSYQTNASCEWMVVLGVAVPRLPDQIVRRCLFFLQFWGWIIMYGGYSAAPSSVTPPKKADQTQQKPLHGSVSVSKKF